MPVICNDEVKQLESLQHQSIQDLFDLMDESGHEQIVFCRHSGSGLKAIIAIHDTTLGPALGGCRMQDYATTEEALQDVLRLSKGMTYKSAVADVDFGGGKMVVIGDPKEKSPELFRAIGRFVAGLNGRFYTGTDMGTDPEDFVHARRESKAFVGLPKCYGGSGDTSLPTAHGVYQGIRATLKYLYGDDSLSGKTFAIQGVGKVGGKLVNLLLEEGATCYISDIDEGRCLEIQEMAPDRVTICNWDEIHKVPCDIFAPCAIGGVLNYLTIPELRCRAVVGSANNQLSREQDGFELHQREIWYAPDYLVNAGGLIQVATELEGGTEETSIAKTKSIYEGLLEIYRVSEQDNIPTCQAADQLVERRLNRIADLHRIFPGR